MFRGVNVGNHLLVISGMLLFYFLHQVECLEVFFLFIAECFVQSVCQGQ